MNLNLQDYTDPQEVIKRADHIVSTWAYMRYMDEKDDQESILCLEQDSEADYKWLEENAPWFIPFVDWAVVRVLTNGR